jgi:phosphate butyryltransferase
MELKNLDQLIELSRKKPRRRIAVANATDKPVLEAVFQAYKLGIIEPYLIGNSKQIIKLAVSIGLKNDMYEIVDEPDILQSCKKAVRLVKEGHAEILMKGRVQTAVLLRAVLDKESGLNKRNRLSHFALIQTNYYHKLLGITDAGMNISPGIKEKINIVENAVEILHQLGYTMPKVAIIAPLEFVNPKIASSTDADILTSMNRKNQINGCIIDGPFALDIAVSKEASLCKGIISEVAGDADILVTHDINSGNILYKSLIFLSDGIAAAIITGASSPIVLTSRADSKKSKLFSIALAAALD